MADEIRVNRQDGPMGDVRDRMERSGSSKLPWIILAIVVVVLIVLGVLFRDKLSGNKATTEAGKASDYSAVFLTNGQVYFGKLSDADSQYATLTDIYYLQVTTEPALQGSGTQQQQQQQQLSLVKLGQELHGPVDSMRINRDQILFFEEMKEDGKVMQAIREYQKNPPAANTQGQTPATPPQAPVNQVQPNTNTNSNSNTDR